MSVCSEEVVMPLDAVHEVERELRAAGVPSPRVDAEILVAEVLGLARSELYASGRDVSGFEAQRLRALVERRVAREPLAYILGEWGFRHLDLKVDDRALVPRPETEVVVERCLEFMYGLSSPRVLDVGVGSGAIALSIADEHEGATVLAVDSSANALELARENHARVGVNGRVRLLQADLLEGVEGPFDLVVSNPPYIAAPVIGTLEPEVQEHDPRLALDGGPDGLDAYRAILADAPRLVAPGGHLLLEVGYDQADEIGPLLAGLSLEIRAIVPDLSGTPRCVALKRT
jgi:release factor glutamine methyltransferase